MAAVELIYDDACPNVGEARRQILKAFSEAGVTPRWSEYRIGDADAPPHIRGYGSPTVLIDGRDVSGATPDNETCCRLYEGELGDLSRVPSVLAIVAALKRISSTPNSTRSPRGWRSSLALLPGIVLALLPKVACPACWPAYAGFLSSIGLGFLIDNAWLLPFTAAFLIIAVGALAFRARVRRGYAPFALGSAAAVLVLVGKFVLESDAAMYAGIGLLVAASIWNTWPRRQIKACAACVDIGSINQGERI